MLKPYTVYFRFKCPGDKKPGAMKQFRLYADSAEQARRLAKQQANYPNIEVLTVKPA